MTLEPGWHRGLRLDDVAYDVLIPAQSRGRTLLVLPGWNNSRTSWIEHTRLESLAERYGYALVLPELGKTVYASSYYPETTLKWNAIPGGRFLRERLLPEMARRHGLLAPGSLNFLLGLSTGGRGVALTALENPGLFRAGAALSGDFDQARMPRDRLMTAVYGPFSRFPARWTGRDNPGRRVLEWKMPLYLAHGLRDKIVPEEQSRLFYEALRNRLHDSVPIEYLPVREAGHDYAFWAGQLPAVFDFFKRCSPM